MLGGEPGLTISLELEPDDCGPSSINGDVFLLNGEVDLTPLWGPLLDGLFGDNSLLLLLLLLFVILIDIGPKGSLDVLPMDSDAAKSKKKLNKFQFKVKTLK